MTIMVTGAAGQLGRELVRTYSGDDRLVSLDRIGLNVTNRAAVHAAVRSIRPSVIVNCAAWTDVDGCEDDPDRAFLVHADAVRFLREAANEVGAHVVQISTDYVFDGLETVPYIETAATNPLNVYGQSKKRGETFAGPLATIVRTSWLQAADAPGMVDRILSGLSVRKEVALPADRRACPTFVGDLAPVIWRLAEERVAGLVHATNGGATNWYEFGRSVADAAGVDPDRIIPISVEQSDERPAQRPPYSALDNSFLQTLGYPEIRDHRDAVAEAVTGAVG